MQYTCAYFKSPNDSLEKAQAQKMDLVCRKLRLKKDETVVEAGCGWGGFALYAVRNFGVKMRSYNISTEQIAYARERAKKFGIPERRLEYVHDDYRTIGGDGSVYDKFVSIGMLEHVGTKNYRTLYNIIDKVTKPGGLALIHSISRAYPNRTDPWIEKYIFPGGQMPSLAEMVTPVEEEGRHLHVIDVENLRYHYALTLDHWSERFEKNADRIREKYGEAFVRMFRLYLRSSAAGFRYGGVLLYQMLLSCGFNNEAPLTRHHMFDTAKALQKKNGSEKKRPSSAKARKKK
jgi:cyclopropane-fatty-acyl-phospholipid synthase